VVHWIHSPGDKATIKRSDSLARITVTDVPYEYEFGRTPAYFLRNLTLDETNATSDLSTKLFPNLTPEVGASTNGADLRSQIRK
jgi:hypothetical protein